MYSENNWFTLVEIIVATIILTVGVFGVYKIIAINMSLIASHGRYEAMLALENPLRACLLSSSWALNTKASGYEFYVSFGSDLMGCSIESSETGITLNETTFYATGTVLSKVPTTSIEYSITEPNHFWHLPEGTHTLVIP